MEKYGLNELREKFLRFFESKDHLRMESFSLIPLNDPSILLINAGMTPLKPYFTGEMEPPSKRVTTCQKCIRTPDIDRVGITARHGTFFEMLGNFSFGEYFKKEAIAWAWEFFIRVLDIPGEKLWISVYEEDDEAYDIWHEDIGIKKEKIVKMGKEDNFWEHGTGPCGPCSEIYYDRGPKWGCVDPDCKPGCECDRYVEVWNLVFTQFNKDEEGNYIPLDKKNIDTGMGLERLACIMQDVDSLFEVDTIRNILKQVLDISKKEYGKDRETDISVRVITDHIRSTVMMISDGIVPSNEQRGYVLRRLLRRAVRHGRLLGIKGAFLSSMVDVVVEESKQAYPELEENREYIRKVIGAEEDRFEMTIDQGLEMLNEYMDRQDKKSTPVISGDFAFRLHDTYGFPFELTKEIAREKGFATDDQGFEREMEEQRNKARQALKKKEGNAWASKDTPDVPPDFETVFTGYGTLQDEAVIKYIFKDGKHVETLNRGEGGTIFLDRTPFYPESGGQVGDTGSIECLRGKFRVTDTQRTPMDHILHFGHVTHGSISINGGAKVLVDREKRVDTARNHTATHILHRALKNNLGAHVSQAGSLVDEKRLRFDFSHFEPMEEAILRRIEREINGIILEDLPVRTEEMSLEEAKKEGITALFGEKYKDVVRVVRTGKYSSELCGGTHVNSTSKIGSFKILSETGIAAGVRRIEALTGSAFMEYFFENEKILAESARTIKGNPSDIPERIRTLNSEIRSLKRDLDRLKEKMITSDTQDLIKGGREISGITLITHLTEQGSMEGLRTGADAIKVKLKDTPAVIVLATSEQEKVSLVVACTKKAVEMGLKAGKIIGRAAKAVGGGGGGRDDMAQAGGKNPRGIGDAFKIVEELIKETIGG